MLDSYVRCRSLNLVGYDQDLKKSSNYSFATHSPYRKTVTGSFRGDILHIAHWALQGSKELFLNLLLVTIRYKWNHLDWHSKTHSINQLMNNSRNRFLFGCCRYKTQRRYYIPIKQKHVLEINVTIVLYSSEIPENHKNWKC